MRFEFKAFPSNITAKIATIAIVAAAAFTTLIAGCTRGEDSAIHAQKNAAALRQLSADERAQDFDQLLSLFKNYYGPYDYKERRLGLSIETLIKDMSVKAQGAKTDEEFAGYVMQVGAALRDGHVQIQVDNSSSGISVYSIPLVLTPIEGKAIIGGSEDALNKEFHIAVGDEVLAVDGKSPFDYLPTILKYRSTARTESDQHGILYVLRRPSYMTDLVPTSKFAQVSVRNAAGQERTVSIPWTTRAYNEDARKVVPNSRLDLSVPFADELNAPTAHRMQMGQVDPIFVTEKSQAAYKFVKVYPSDATRKAFGLADNEKPPIYAALYRYSGKTILLVRQATYSPKDFKNKVYLKAYQALLSEFEPLADVLVLDQTHNPGGSYCADFYDLFARQGDRQSAELVHADRKWINDMLTGWQEEEPELAGTWEAKTYAAYSQVVEQAYDKHLRLSDPVPLFTSSFYSQKRDFAWSKPMLVLIDELAGSCGDMFPMLIKANGRAKLFGQTTMGLGGNVEEVGVLSNSRIKVRMTRGMFYPYNPSAPPVDSDFIENNGAAADIPYSHTVNDFRNGFVDYIKTFSEAAIQQ